MRNMSIPTLIFIIIMFGLILTYNAGFATIINTSGPQLVNFIRALTGRDSLTGRAQYAR